MEGAHDVRPIEEPIASALAEAIDCLRDTGKDPTSKVFEVEPILQKADRAWRDSNISEPSAKLRGLAFALRTELHQTQMKLQARGRALARVKRAIEEVRGATYTRSASRVTSSLTGVVRRTL